MKKFMNVLCVLILVLTLIDLVVDFFFTGDHAVSLKDLNSFSMGSLLGLLLVCLVIISAAVMSFVYFIKFILNVNRNKVFTDKNINLLRKYGVCALLIGVCVIILSISIITGNSFADALSDGINALVEGFFALLMGEVFGIGLKLKESKKSDTL